MDDLGLTRDRVGRTQDAVTPHRVRNAGCVRRFRGDYARVLSCFAREVRMARRSVSGSATRPCAN